VGNWRSSTIGASLLEGDFTCSSLFTTVKSTLCARARAECDTALLTQQHAQIIEVQIGALMQYLRPIMLSAPTNAAMQRASIMLRSKIDATQYI
jgi:hypothetical protein